MKIFSDYFRLGAITIALACFVASSAAVRKATVTLKPLEADSAEVIPAEIYGQFAEHLGSCIYGGLWVGVDSPIANTNGYRTDVLEALKELKVPVLRWPGGCFADEYHWMDGVGPKENRPVMVNTNWGGTVEDNSFGTHEFFNLCELLECEPYLSGNVGSGTVEELSKWVEYITAQDGPMANLRKQNGREQPWKLKYLGVGNESWGCGGHFTPEDYAGEYRRFQTYCRNYGDNKLYKIASGASDYDYNWTDVMMKKARRHMHGLSLHYYTVMDWKKKGSATEFDDDAYYATLAKCLDLKNVVSRHDSIMNIYDPEKKVALLVDEWGTWWDVEPGTNPGHLFQQNTMRDAIVAALSLNIFHDHVDRVKMANIAQIANVLQSMVLTRDDEMVLTPTYYLFKLYAPHQNARRVPLNITSELIRSTPRGDVDNLYATASEKNGVVTVTITNADLTSPVEVEIPLGALKAKDVKGEILTSDSIADYNDFGKDEKVTLKEFKGAKIKNGVLTLTLPAHSVVGLTLK